MNKKELIKLLDKYEIEYEIANNTKEVEEGLRLFDEALEKIGIVIPKEARVDTVTTEWASSSDLISRQGVIRAICQGCVHGGYDECSVDCVVAEILRELPPVEDAISRADTIKALCQECEMKCVCNHDCTEVAVVKGMPPKKQEHGRLIDADALLKPVEESWKHAGLHAEDYKKIKKWIKNAPTIVPPVIPTEHKTTETMMVNGELMGIDPLSYEVGYTHGQFSERPKGEWVEFRKPCYDGTAYYWKKCSVCDHDMIGYETNFCPNCGAKMKEVIE